MKEVVNIFNKYYWLSAIIIAKNNIMRQYRDSFLGIAWTLIQPAIQITIYSTIFAQVMHVDSRGFVLQLVANLLLWGFLSSCLTGSVNSIIANGDVFKRCTVSKTIFPIADILKNLYTYILSVVVMYTVLVLYSPSSFHVTALLLPVYLLTVLAFILPLAIAISFLAPYFRDIGDFINIGISICFWLTPILYREADVKGGIATFIKFNPFWIIIRPINKVVYYGTLPTLQDHTSLFIVLIIANGIGYSIYRLCRRNFVYYL